MTAALVFIGAALVAAIVIALLRRSALATRLGDRPNERSLHTEVTPRVGGLGLMLAAVPFAAWHASPSLAVVLGVSVLLAIVSVADDARNLPIAVRLCAHVAAALAAAIAFMPHLEGLWGLKLFVFVVLAIAWMTNLFNFMDGADGLAGGMGAIGFGTLAFVAFQAGAAPLALACTALAGASVGFIAWNFPPARVFMGDAGSIPLGFLAGALGLAGVGEAAWPWWFPLMVFSPFIVDASVTLLRRLLRREKVWRAHREHAYQRIVLAGWSKKRMVLHAYALMIAVAACASAALRQGPFVRCAIISGCAVAYVLLLAAIERRCRKASHADRQTPASGFGP